MISDNKSEEQRHYENLIRYFKYLVTITIAAITILVGVGIFFTYQNISDARQEVTKNLSEINNNVRDVTEKSLRSFENLQRQAREEVRNFKEDIRNYALNETKIKVAEAFEENKIRRLIEITAVEKLKKNLNSIVEKQMKIVPTLILAVDKIRSGNRRGLVLLDSLRNQNKDPFIRDLANKSFNEKERDYKKFYSSYANNKTLKYLIERFHLDSNISVKDTLSILKGIVSFIQSEKRLDNVARAISALNKISGRNFNMFDFKRINKWAKMYFKNE